MNTLTLIRLSRALFVVLFSALLVACGDDDAAGVQVVEGPGDEVDYTGSGTTVVVVDDQTYVVTGDPGSDCVQIEDVCVDLDQGQYCQEEGAQVDVIVVDGEVVEVICYPAPEGTPIDEVTVGADGTAEVPQNESGSVIVFDESTDGEPIVGDVYLAAERTTLFGNGVDETIIQGNVTVESNNSRVRGVTITGNLIYTQNSNNSAGSFCKVHGNLEVASNDFTLTNCLVFGNVVITGNNAVLVNLGVQGDCSIGAAQLCDGCYSFDDADGDFVVADEELGGPACMP